MASFKKINICLHNIVNSKKQIKSSFDLTEKQLRKLLEELDNMKLDKIIDSYDLFFDDGYKSFMNILNKINFNIKNSQIHIAVIFEKIGQVGYLNKEDLCYLDNLGFSIDSHSISHASLAIYNEKDVLEKTPKKGLYRNTPYGKNKILSENEILYQMLESFKLLSEYSSKKEKFFVLPYGIYNKEIVLIAATLTGYSRIYSCDLDFDFNQYIAPRIIIDQKNINCIKNIIVNMS